MRTIDRPEPTDAEVVEGYAKARAVFVENCSPEWAYIVKRMEALARAGLTAQADLAALRAERDALAGDAERWRALQEPSDALVERACRDREALDFGPRDYHPWDCLVDQEPDMADVERDKMRMFLSALTTPDAPEQAADEGEGA